MTVFWVGFLVLVVILLALDLGVFHRDAHAVSLKEATGWTFVWITLGLSFTGFVWAMFEYGWGGAQVVDGRGQPMELTSGGGTIAATRYVTAYLLEKSLSVDNIFVIALVFGQFKVAAVHRHRVLFWGVLGAIVMRGAMLLSGVWLLQKFEWLFYVFGAYLIYTGLKLFVPEKGEVEGEDPGPESGFIGRLRRWFNVAPDEVDHGGHFFVRVDGKRMMSKLGLCLIVIEWMDLVFALDSIPAVLAVAPDSFIVFTSNIFAILGLRSLYFVLENAIHKFGEIRYALAIILTFIGVKLVIHSWVHVPNWISLSLIVVSLTVAVGISMARQRARASER